MKFLFYKRIGRVEVSVDRIKRQGRPVRCFALEYWGAPQFQGTGLTMWIFDTLFSFMVRGAHNK